MSHTLDVLLILCAFVGGTFASLTSNDFNLLSMVKELQEKSQTHESIIQSLHSQIAKQDDQIIKLLAHEKQLNERTSNLEDLVHTLLEQERQQNERITKQDDLIHSLLEQGKRQNERIAKQENLISILKVHNRQLYERVQNQKGFIRMDVERKELDDVLYGLGSGKPTNGSSEPHFTPQGKMTPRKFKKDVRQTPATIAFQANVRSNDVAHIGLHQKIVFDDVIMNIGDAYHSQHGLFIAPRQGLYIFSASVLSFDGYMSIECGIMKNGVFLGGAISNVHKNQAQGSATVVTQLNMGDEVWVENIYPADTSVHRDYTAFMGCLISDN